MEFLSHFFSVFLSADGRLLLLIQEYVRQDRLTPFMTWITGLGDRGLIWIIIGVLLLIPKKTRRTGLLSLLSLLCAHLLCNMVLKDYVMRVRPYEVIDGLYCLIERPTDYSFPSGHTMTAFAAAVVIFKNRPKRLGIPVMALAFVIAFSRLYVGVHYPSDVIIGALLGTLIAMIFFWIFGDKKYKRIETAVRIFALHIKNDQKSYRR